MIYNILLIIIKVKKPSIHRPSQQINLVLEKIYGWYN